MFSEAIFDILVILDCSHLIIDAAIRSRDPHDGLYGRIELLAATSNTAKTGQPEGGSFTNAVTTTMRDMITKYGSIDIAELHALLVQQASNSYTVPIYVPLREGASEQTLVLERLLGEQEQRVTNWKEPMISHSSAGGFLSRLNSLPYAGKEPFRNDTSSQPPGGETIDSLNDFSILKQRPRSKKTFPTRNIHTTKADNSHLHPNLKGERTRSLPKSALSLDEILTPYSTFTIGLRLVKAVAQRLIKDTKAFADLEPISQIPPLEIGTWLEVFAWRLHEESTTPLEWKASVCLFEESR